ncbi:MAG: Gfo/Idh/MocA family oxidoreductase, partial [Candidatus Latescibacteria bacterium]|nr:Gfo/Idh/MocA family oxidoreductase [Candidatus Latescibacterota bacterium]
EKLAQSIGADKPHFEYDFRRVLDDKDIDAVSIATPEQWHALQTIWACQAGKDVYVEKPVSHNIWEGRKSVEAARKYNRIVAAGTQQRSFPHVQEAIRLLHSGVIGDVYIARGLCYKPRETIGRKQDCPVPDGVHYDLWLGPAPLRSFNENRFHYNWHWFWDYGCGDIGNQGPHEMDVARWGLNKHTLPEKIYSSGGYFAFDSDQETPNTQSATFTWEDGKILQFDVRGLYTNNENELKIGNLFYGSEGWMHLDINGFTTWLGRKDEPGPSMKAVLISEEAGIGGPQGFTETGAHTSSRIMHRMNFIDAVRSRAVSDLTADILVGHISTSLSHLANISYRLGRELRFDTHSERFIDDDRANAYLTRNYRHPYVVPEDV